MLNSFLKSTCTLLHFPQQLAVRRNKSHAFQMRIKYFPAQRFSFQIQSSGGSAPPHFHLISHWLLSKTCLTCNYFQPISQKACSIHLSVGQISTETDKKILLCETYVSRVQCNAKPRIFWVYGGRYEMQHGMKEYL